MQTREALRCPPVCDITMITAVGELEQQVLSSLLALKTRLQSLMEGRFADVKAPCSARRGADGQVMDGIATTLPSVRRTAQDGAGSSRACCGSLCRTVKTGRYRVRGFQ